MLDYNARLLLADVIAEPKQTHVNIYQAKLLRTQKVGYYSMIR